MMLELEEVQRRKIWEDVYRIFRWACSFDLFQKRLVTTAWAERQKNVSFAYKLEIMRLCINPTGTGTIRYLLRETPHFSFDTLFKWDLCESERGRIWQIMASLLWK